MLRQTSSDFHWRTLWKHGWLLAATIIFSFLVAVLSLTLPFFMLLVYDRVLSSRSAQTLTALLLLSICLLVGMAALDFARRRVLARFAGLFQANLEAHLLDIPIHRRTPGTSRDICLEDLDRLRAFMHSGALLKIMDVLWLPLYLGAVFILSPMIGRLACVGLLIATIVFAVGKLLAVRTAKDAERASTLASNMMLRTKYASDWMPGLGINMVTKNWLLQQRAKSRDAVIRATDASTAIIVILNMMRSILAVVVLSAAAGLVMTGQLTVGGMVAVVVLLNRVYAPYVAFLRTTPAMRQAYASWKKISKMLSARPSLKFKSDAVRLFNGPLLEVSGLNLDNPMTGQALLEHANLRVESGEIVEVIGRTNSGKTLLSETIVGARQANRGTVLIRGHQVNSLTDAELRKLVGFVPEVLRFLPGSISSAVSGPVTTSVSTKVESAVAATGLHGRISALPDGYETIIDETGAPLGGADRLLLALARALFHDPRLVIIDGPSSHFLQTFAEGKREVVETFLSSGGSLMIFNEARSELPWDTRSLIIEGRKLLSIQDKQPFQIASEVRA